MEITVLPHDHCYICRVCVESSSYHRWRDTLWNSWLFQNASRTGRCSSPRPGWTQVGWWAGCQTERHSTTLFLGTVAQSWGHRALRRRPHLRGHRVLECTSIWSAAPSQVSHRSRRRTPSYHSLLFGCRQPWLVLRTEGGDERREQEKTERVRNSARLIIWNMKHGRKTVTGICSSCSCLEALPPPISSPLTSVLHGLIKMTELLQLHQQVLRG